MGHPKTGRVCVPFRVSKVDSFDPEKVPTVLQLVEEIDSFSKAEEESEVKRNVKAYKMTSMREPVSISRSSCPGWPASARASSSLRATQKWKSEKSIKRKLLVSK